MRWIACAVLLSLAIGGVGSRSSPDRPRTRFDATCRRSRTATPARHTISARRRCAGGKEKEVWVKEQKTMMGVADVKIFDFTVYPGKVEGDKAQVPNVLESQDKFVNTLGLTEHELYTLIREDGGWKVDSQILSSRRTSPSGFHPVKRTMPRPPRPIDTSM
jgi:hypothetical protein